VEKQSNQFVWVFMGICAVIVSVIVVVIEKRKDLKNE